MSLTFVDVRARERTHARTIELLAFWRDVIMPMQGKTRRPPTNRYDDHSLINHRVSVHIQLWRIPAARTGIGLNGVIAGLAHMSTSAHTPTYQIGRCTARKLVKLVMQYQYIAPVMRPA